MGWQGDKPYIEAEDDLVMELTEVLQQMGHEEGDAYELAQFVVTPEMIHKRVLRDI